MVSEWGCEAAAVGRTREVPASNHVIPNDSTISSCGVPPARDLPWIDMVQMIRMLQNIIKIDCADGSVGPLGRRQGG